MFCIAIKKTLVVSTCPLNQGTCYWQHKITNKCKYKEGMALDEFCAATATPMPSKEELAALSQKIRLHLN